MNEPILSRRLPAALAILCLSGLLAAGAWAQAATPAPKASPSPAASAAPSASPLPETTEAPASPAADDGLEAFDSAAYFGDEADAQVAEEVKSDAPQAENFLSEAGVKLGGNYRFSLSTGTRYKKDYADWNGDYLLTGGVWDGTSNEEIENSSLDLGGSLWFSARPSDSVRYYGKVNIDYPFSDLVATVEDLAAATDSDPATVATGTYVPNLKIWELFADFNIDSKVFLRAGKQMVKWGVGYFFQPADIISLSAVDVNDPTADREGPLAIKANIPLGVHNLDFYTIAPGNAAIESITDIGLAGRFKFVLDTWEFSLGAAYQKDTDWNFTATASGSIWDFSVFGEALVKRLSAGSYLNGDATTINLTMDPDGAGPLPVMTIPTAVDHTLVTDRTDWFFSGTTGFMYSNTDAYLTLIGQYYFNGEGYEDPTSIIEDALTYVAAGQMSIGELFGNLGRHYAAGMVSWSFVKDSKVALSLLWLGNLSDGSGFFKPTVKFDFTDEIALSVSPYFAYGPETSQYRGISPDLMGGSDALVMPTASVSLTLSLAGGKF